MKKQMRIVMAMMVVAIALPLQAQKKGEPCGKLEKHVQFMKDSLNLTSDQTTKVEEIKANACIKLQNAVAETEGNKEARHEKVSQIMKETHQAMAAVLNDDQKAKMKAHKESMKGKHDHEKLTADQKAEKMTEKMKSELSLTEAQIPKVKAANLNLVTQREALKAKKAAGADTATLKAEGKAMMKSYRDEMKTILDKDQMAKLKEMRKNSKGKHGEKKPARKSE